MLCFEGAFCKLQKRAKAGIGGRRGFRRREFSFLFFLSSYFLNRRVLSANVSAIVSVNVSARLIRWRLPRL
jgi:hypothetical protein